MKRPIVVGVVGLAATAVLLLTRTETAHAGGSVKLLNVTYDPTRELHPGISAAFAMQRQAKAGRQSR